MSRDYKPAQRKSSASSSNKGSSFFTGLLVGLLLGVGISVAVAIVVMKSDSPFSDKAGKPKELEPGEIALPKAEPKPNNAATEPSSERRVSTSIPFCQGQKAR